MFCVTFAEPTGPSSHSRPPGHSAEAWQSMAHASCRQTRAGDGAFCGAHPLGDDMLREPCSRTRFEHLVGESIFQLQCIIGLSEALALGCASQKGLMVVCYRLVLEISHVVAPWPRLRANLSSLSGVSCAAGGWFAAGRSAGRRMQAPQQLGF